MKEPEIPPPTLEELVNGFKESVLDSIHKPGARVTPTLEMARTLADTIVVLRRLSNREAVQELLDALKLMVQEIIAERDMGIPEHARTVFEILEIIGQLESGA